MKTYRTIGLMVIVPILIAGYFSIVNAQSIVPGIHGMSIVNGVKFTWVIISSDSEISVNLRYVGQDTTPPVTLVATALTNHSQSGGTSTMAGSQLLDAGWVSPNSVIFKVEGASSLYDADLVTVVASPHDSASQLNPSPSTNSEINTPPPVTNEPPTSNSPSNEPTTDSQLSTPIPITPSDESTSSTNNAQTSPDNEAKSSSSNCDPSYPDFCIPPPPPDLNCADISHKRFTVQGSDPHGFDRDKDGVGCES